MTTLAPAFENKARAARTTKTPSPDDIDWVSLSEKIRAGDQDAAAVLYDDLRKRTFPRIRRIVGDTVAEEIFHHAYMKTYQAIMREQIDTPEHTPTFSYRVCLNEAYDCLRKRSCREDYESGFDGTLEPFLPDRRTVLASEGMITKERAALVHRAIDSLPLPYQKVIQMRYLEEMSVEETAETLGMNENTVKVRLYRARQAILGFVEREMSKENRLRHSPQPPPSNKLCP